MTSVKFKLMIEIDGTEVISEYLGSECVSSLAGRLPDIAENKALFGHLAKSTSSEVRSEIAYKDHLNEETVELLSQDNSVDVRRRICGQKPFREWACTEILLNYISADIECAKTIAGSISDYGNADVNDIAIEICEHPDPDVRNALAGSWGAPKKILKKLLSDPDASVRASAQRSLD
jgi:HEAT repeat protein